MLILEFWILLHKVLGPQGGRGMGQGVRACNGNLAVIAQGCMEGKWSHVLERRGAAIAPGATVGQPPAQLGRMMSLQ